MLAKLNYMHRALASTYVTQDYNAQNGEGFLVGMNFGWCHDVIHSRRDRQRTLNNTQHQIKRTNRSAIEEVAVRSADSRLVGSESRWESVWVREWERKKRKNTNTAFQFVCNVNSRTYCSSYPDAYPICTICPLEIEKLKGVSLSMGNDWITN